MNDRAGVALLERRRELERAGELLSGAQGGEGAMLLIDGPGGIGKTALIGEVRRRADAQGFTVLAARGAELERDFPFGVVRQLFEPVLARADPEGRRPLLAGAAYLALPAVGDPEPTPDVPAGSPSVDPSFSVLHGLYWLTSNLAEVTPLLIAVDDGQWSDSASLRFLAYLAGRLDGLPIMATVGRRRFEPGSPVELLAALEGEATSTVIQLAPLTETGTGELVRARLGSEPIGGLSAACHRATGGNPQLIHELVAAIVAERLEPTPGLVTRVAELRADRIASSILIRLGRVGGPALALARAVAVLGREARPDLIAELTGFDPDEAERAADALVALEILAPGVPLSFVHPIVRTAVYNDFDPIERNEAHRRAARALAGRAADLDSIAAQIVATPAVADGWCVAQLIAAGDAALASGAPDAAVTYLEWAVAADPPSERRRDALIGLGRAFAMLRDRRRAIKRLRAALELTDEQRLRIEIVHILFAEIAVSRAAGRAIELLDRELASLPADEHELGIRLESDIDSASFFSLGAKHAAEDRVRRFSDPNHPRMLASAAMSAAIYDGTSDRARTLALRADGERMLREEGPDSPMVWTIGFALLYAHQLAEAMSLADAWRSAASRRGSLRAYSLASSLRTRAAHWIGDLAEAEADARAFSEGMPEAVGLGPAFLADILLDQGRVEDAEAALALSAAADDEVEWSFFYPALLISRGAVLIATGNPTKGCDSLLGAGEAAADWGVSTPGAIQWRPVAAEGLAAIGERDHAVRLIEVELDSCRRFGSPRALGVALRAAGRIDLHGAGLEAMRKAVAVLGASGARLELGRALIDFGATLRRRGNPAEARQPLQRGLAIARSCGAVTLAEYAHEELTATGIRPRKIVRTGVDALTASERRVARMAAAGQSNKEIAQDLFVTVRTVEAHLHHAYQKLEISSRDELAAALGNAVDRP